MKDKNPRRSAPRRRVIQIVRTGRYPDVHHLHRLACGHTEARKREAKTPDIGCTTCGAIGRLSPVTIIEPVDQFNEMLYAGTRAEIVAALGCDASAVNIEIDSTGNIRGAKVFLTANEIQQLRNRLGPNR